MCGIAGIDARGHCGVSLDDITPMTATLDHRGPDRAATLRRGRVALGSTRLAIVDLAGSHQPMTSADGRFAIVLNGEIFNYRQLRADLERVGARFRTRGDTEVALQLLALRGPAAIADLDGQFALAFHDAGRDRLVLARDRYGICPLYYREQGGAVAFASEPRALQASPTFRAAGLDLAALVDMYVLWGFLPGASSLRDVRQVDPGCWLEVRADGCRQHRYWAPEPAADAADVTAAEAVEQVTTLLRAAVERRLADEVPTAVLLSGGLDSSAVTALASAVGPVRTFGIGFADRAYDETREQLTLARHLGTDHHILEVDTAQLLKQLPEAVAHAGMPLTRMAPVATYQLARELALHQVRVVLTGEGADEMLLGYDVFKLAQARESRHADPATAPTSSMPRLNELPMPERAASLRDGHRLAMPLGLDAAADADPAHPCFSHVPRWDAGRRLALYLQPGWRQEVTGRPYPELMAGTMAPGAQRAPVLRRAQALELMTFLPTMLLGGQSDRMLMAHSVEGRYPFLDNALVDALLALPAPLLAPQPGPEPREKLLLRQAMAGLLPREARQRPKQAYTAPLRGPLGSPAATPLFEQYLSPSALGEVGLFDPARMGWLVRRAGSSGGLSGEDARVLLFALTTQMLHSSLVEQS
jgi:asparagine synthase (glutamine-hydrolysing)